jgi:hypothetical protein
MSPRVLAAYSLFAGLAFCTQVRAAEGKLDAQSCYVSPAHVIQVADGIMYGSYDSTGTTPGTEGTPFYMVSGRCVGSFTLVSGDYNEAGGCEYWNAAGDKYSVVYARKGDPAKAEGTWRFVQGTGKFAGISGGGNWMPIGTFPPVPNVLTACNHEWGTYSIK